MGRSLHEDRPLIEDLAEVRSTNTELLERASRGAVHGTAITARRQTAGRGRLGRTWVQGEGNLYLSVLLRDLPASVLPWVTLGAGVCITEHTGPRFQLKWPNDVLDDAGRKLAGVLCEATWSAGKLEALVVGIGLNCVHVPPGTPGTSLAEHGIDIPRTVLAERLRHALVNLDYATVPARWKARSCTLGREVVIHGVRGVAEDLGPDGGLVVRTADGVRTVRAGDVVFCSTTG